MVALVLRCRSSNQERNHWELDLFTFKGIEIENTPVAPLTRSGIIGNRRLPSVEVRSVLRQPSVAPLTRSGIIGNNPATGEVINIPASRSVVAPLTRSGIIGNLLCARRNLCVYLIASRSSNQERNHWELSCREMGGCPRLF